MERKELESKLNKELLQACNEAKKFGVFPTLFITMLGNDGPIEASKKVVNKDEGTQGYADLLIIGKTYLSVEHIISKPEYKDLFDEITLKNARKRLDGR